MTEETDTNVIYVLDRDRHLEIIGLLDKKPDMPHITGFFLWYIEWTRKQASQWKPSDQARCWGCNALLASRRTKPEKFYDKHRAIAMLCAEGVPEQIEARSREFLQPILLGICTKCATGEKDAAKILRKWGNVMIGDEANPLYWQKWHDWLE